MALTDKQQRFVEEYLIDRDTAQAALRAGYSPKTAMRIGCENLRKPKIQKAIEAAQKDRSKRERISADRVLEELGGLAFGESSDRNGTVLKTSSKLKALELLGKHFGLWEKKNKPSAEQIHVTFETEMETWTL